MDAPGEESRDETLAGLSELSEATLAIDVAEMVEEAASSFVHLFARFGIPFEPLTFTVTYAAALCSSAGLDGERTLALLKETGRLEETAARVSEGSLE